MKLDTFVTGVLVTGKDPGRYPLAMRAVRSWLRQTYPGPRELLIINDHPQLPLFQNDIPEGVRELRLDTRLSLGALRNYGIEMARGDYLIQWDDDDYSSAGRLNYQVENTPEDQVTIFKWEVHFDLSEGFAFANNGRTIRCKGFPGTMLWPRKSTVRFPEIGKAEDTEFLLEMQKERKILVLDNDPLLYVRCYHGLNTWSRRHVMRPKPGYRALTSDERAYVKSIERL